ncbi:MAG TPA: MOSC N-terminal beta barrel domain-containing protein [Burkholderiaceae bacterium]|nr:MOSC N-terminal beta barrel domain-containing protein [Burkholderiaceae bacterium]
MSEQTVAIAGLYVHPVKSCARIGQDRALVTETGLEWDRQWMVVDESGEFVSQREEPRLALVRPSLRASDLVLRAPGMLALHVALDAIEREATVAVWDDRLRAGDMGDLAAQWFSDFLGRRVRLARFDPDVQRVSDPRWTGSINALTAFADAFALLVVSQAALTELNRRLAMRGAATVESDRFRPNLVLDGIAAHEEDWIDRITFDTAEGPVVLRLVKPCTRCSIPDVDPQRGQLDHAVSAELATYRADARMDGRVTFGMNAIVEDGIDRWLQVGASGRATIRFG